MTEINPPARTRIRPKAVVDTPPVSAAPRVRVRPKPVDPTQQEASPAPRVRVRTPVEPSSVNPWYVPPGARPLGTLQKTHNGVTPVGGELPDPRFKPLLIVLSQGWRKNLPPDVRYRFEEARKLTPETVSKVSSMTAANAYIMEYGMRHKLGWRGLPDPVYDALRAKIIADWDDTDPKTCIFVGTKGVMTITEDGDITIDYNKNAGPFYCDSMLAIEHHFKNLLQPVARSA